MHLLYVNLVYDTSFNLPGNIVIKQHCNKTFLGHRCDENNERMGIHDDHEAAPKLNILMG